MVEGQEFGTASVTTAEQTQLRDWEESFKGMQRKFQAEEEKAKAKDSVAIAEAQKRLDAERKLTETTFTYESRLTEAQAQAKAKDDALTAKELELQRLNAKVAAQEKRDALRKQIATTFDPEMMAFYEAGYLKPFKEDGSVMEGEELSSYVNGFKEMMAGKLTAGVQKTIEGAKPQALSAQAQKAQAMTAAQLSTWVNDPANLSDASYSDMLARYIDLEQENSKQ